MRLDYITRRNFFTASSSGTTTTSTDTMGHIPMVRLSCSLAAEDIVRSRILLWCVYETCLFAVPIEFGGPV